MSRRDKNEHNSEHPETNITTGRTPFPYSLTLSAMRIRVPFFPISRSQMRATFDE